MKILVTGGAGYIGSTICSALVDGGHDPVILDSLITGRKEFVKDKIFYKGDISDHNLLKTIFKENPDIKYVIHCAALNAMPEYVKNPYEYYCENVTKSLELFKELNEQGCKNIIFSSCLCVQDEIIEYLHHDCKNPLSMQSPYAKTRYMMGLILKDFSNAYGMRVMELVYANPIGADPKLRSGMCKRRQGHALGEFMNFVLKKVDEGKVNEINGRKYIHVWDLAEAHVKAIENFTDAFQEANKLSENGFVGNYLAINIGGHEAYNSNITEKLLKWKAGRSISQAIDDAKMWRNKFESMAVH